MKDKPEYLINIFDKDHLKQFILKHDMLNDMYYDMTQHILINHDIQINNNLRDSYLASYYKQVAIAKGVM